MWWVEQAKLKSADFSLLRRSRALVRVAGSLGAAAAASRGRPSSTLRPDDYRQLSHGALILAQNLIIECTCANPNPKNSTGPSVPMPKLARFTTLINPKPNYPDPKLTLANPSCVVNRILGVRTYQRYLFFW